MQILIYFIKYVNMKFICLILFILIGYTMLFYILYEMNLLKSNPLSNNETAMILPHVIVHLDLKGAPPKLTYLQETVLPMLKDLGVNGLLIEFEDMFPYDGKLKNLTSKNCYENEDLFAFISYARSNGFEIIPLVQTFGHMEFVLKLEEFQHLRESPNRIDSICPSRDESYEVLSDMLHQVISFLKPLKYIHVGCDEVYHMNQCHKCQERDLSNIELFIDHINKIRDIVISLSPNITVLIWDDMLRHRKLENVSTEIMSGIEPVLWSYGRSVNIEHRDIYLYDNKFNNMWLASAFKGADGSTAMFPNLHNRFQNHISLLNFFWRYTLLQKNGRYNFKGIILTGWSRYSHMEPLCELLPVSLPSLALSLTIIKNYAGNKFCQEGYRYDDKYFVDYITEPLHKTLKCNNNFEDINDVYSNNCSFNGSQLYLELKNYEDIIQTFQNNYYEYHLPYLEYYSLVNITNLNSISRIKNWCKSILADLIEAEIGVAKAMSEYQDIDTIEEYANYKTFHIKGRIHKTLSYFKKIETKKFWDRGPVKKVTMNLNKLLKMHNLMAKNYS